MGKGKRKRPKFDEKRYEGLTGTQEKPGRISLRYGGKTADSNVAMLTRMWVSNIGANHWLGAKRKNLTGGTACLPKTKREKKGGGVSINRLISERWVGWIQFFKKRLAILP